jgi:3',5'-nucleoside bisphosphate phosphatase
MGDGDQISLRQVFRAELHVHTALSPCAEVEMIPPLIIEAALGNGIQIIAVTDHNAIANVQAVQLAAEGTALTVLPGMELQTREEVHILCIFEQFDQLQAWKKTMDQNSDYLPNRPEYFGEQFIVDETGDFIRREDRLLLFSTNLSFEEAVLGIHHLGGLAIPAHIDRKVNGLIANLGFIPEGLPIEALELSRHSSLEKAKKTIPNIHNYPVLIGGDVHRLNEFLGINEFHLEAPTFREIALALNKLEGRYHKIVDDSH